MAQGVQRGTRTTAFAWAVLAQGSLVGVLLLWLISPSAADTAGYGAGMSMVLLVVSMLFTAVGVVTVLTAPQLSPGINWTVTLLLALTAGSLIPLATAGLFIPGTGRYGLLLTGAVAGIAALAVQVPRATIPGQP